MLSRLDIAIIVVYFAILLIVGYLSGRKESKEDFLIGGRAVKAFQSMATLGSSLIGAGMLLSYIALVFTYGAGAIWLFFGYVFGFSIFYQFARYLKPLADQHRFYTLPDFFYYRFGKRAGQFTAIMVVLISIGWIAVNFIGGGKTIETFTGFDFNNSTIIVGIIISAYLILGGFKAVVSTDTIQFIGLFILVSILIHLLYNYSLSLTWADVNIFNISIGELISFFLVGVIVPLASGDLWQRIYAVKDLQTFKKSTIWLSAFLVVFGIILLFIGLIIKKHLPQSSPDTALVEGFGELLPSGWTGLAVVVFYSTIMSSADSYLFAASSSITQDLFHRNTTNSLIQKSRFWIVVLSVIGIALAIFIKEVLGATYFLVALMFVIGIVVLVVWKFKKTNQKAVSLGLLLGLIAVVVGILTIGASEWLIVFALVGVFAGYMIGKIRPDDN